MDLSGIFLQHFLRGLEGKGICLEVPDVILDEEYVSGGCRPDWINIILDDAIEFVDKNPIYNKNGLLKPVLIVISSSTLSRYKFRAAILRKKASNKVEVVSKMADAFSYDPCLLVFFGENPSFTANCATLAIKIVKQDLGTSHS